MGSIRGFVVKRRHMVCHPLVIRISLFLHMGLLMSLTSPIFLAFRICSRCDIESSTVRALEELQCLEVHNQEATSRREEILQRCAQVGRAAQEAQQQGWRR